MLDVLFKMAKDTINKNRKMVAGTWSGVCLAIILIGLNGCAAPMPVSKIERKAGETWQETRTGMEFIWIPEGCFVMGTPAPKGQERFTDESPAHKVCLDGFWMGRFEVTNAQFREFNPGHNSGSFDDFSLNGDQQPVANVNWTEAKEFTRWLSTRNKGGGKFRLPTEAEWEYACRAGTNGSFYWGEEIDPRYVNFSDKNDPTGSSFDDIDDGYAVSAPIGSYLPNYFGLYDMSGNVWEWNEDRYSSDAYSRHDSRNPINTVPDEIWQRNVRVGRGGGWRSHPGLVRCAGRGGSPGIKSMGLGFRVVKKD